ncbi:NAD(P)/FAD-dependent oxidoreductase [Hymenobacter busanensis]|uniref:NAD(P)/FAD-dependent oxidoreductase n=1 Tax=Hymenobacter busanensis TaxID=2607656 RepID=A0A7L4ZXR3_9BACT|nr:NAD(P)/FAD-dependent oxidoreductase [Hymenobacter busanensis]KAA9333031.1 NAD(P)/FAD-dependent oxidoreductase [Hymenobacter busanensis]QHJ08294.1 FAD-dependent oxidoreductase [Hymenobacter busanensis]
MPASARRPFKRPRHIPPTDYEVVVVGAGCAGLSAALVLGRCRRRVLLCDGGKTRNAPSPAVHGFLSRDGIKPQELLRLGREQLQPYTTVESREACVAQTERDPETGSFRVTLDSGRCVTTRKILLATGIADVLPPIEGMRELWGVGVLHCPYCHGYEVSDQPVAVYGRNKSAAGFALLISRWSKDVVVCTDGWTGMSEHSRHRLKRHGIALYEQPIRRLAGRRDGSLRQLEFADGSSLPRQALFIHPDQQQRSNIADQLGCRRLQRSGAVWVDKKIMTTVPGVYAAGDTTPAAQQALVAAAEGAQAAISINEQLTREECS